MTICLAIGAMGDLAPADPTAWPDPPLFASLYGRKEHEVTIVRLSPNELPKYKGVSHLAIVGNWVFIAGQVSTDASGTTEGSGDFEVQMERVFSNLESACRAAGGGLKDLVKTTTFLTDRVHTASLGSFRQRRYGENAPPNSTVIVAGLSRPDWLIEVEGIAYIVR